MEIDCFLLPKLMELNLSSDNSPFSFEFLRQK